MDHFADFLTLLGQHYVLVLVGCVELIAAVVLVGILPRRQKSRAARAADATGTEQLMMRELSRQEDEVCLAVRRSDLLPVKAVGNLEGPAGRHAAASPGGYGKPAKPYEAPGGRH